MLIKTTIKRSLLVGGTIAAVGIAGLGTMGIVSAATTPNSPHQSIIDRIATKFNLNKNDVQKVFDEDKTSHQADRELKMKERLDKAVKDGKLTQDQEDKLIAKLKEMETQRQANRDALKDKTEAERKTAMDTEREAFQKWLTDNNIPAEFGLPTGGPGHMGMHRGGHRGMMDDNDNN